MGADLKRVSIKWDLMLQGRLKDFYLPQQEILMQDGLRQSSKMSTDAHIVGQSSGVKTWTLNFALDVGQRWIIQLPSYKPQ